MDVTLHLADVGGPSAGLFFSLGIIDKLDGNGSGGDLTGGRTIAGTGTIDADGTVGAVGGVSLKTQAARRDGATVFLVPEAECADAKAELPEGLRLIPVTTLKGAIAGVGGAGDGAGEGCRAVSSAEYAVPRLPAGGGSSRSSPRAPKSCPVSPQLT